MRKLLCLLAGLMLAAAAQAGGKPDLPREILVNGVEFILVPGGWFSYPVINRDPKTGEPRSNRKEVKAWVDAYYIGKYEARARDFVRFMAGGPRHAGQYGPQSEEGLDKGGEVEGCAVRRNEAGAYYLVKPEEDLPVTHLSWELANEFAAWMGFRLPTDAEWVRAFRGDDKRVFPWGDEYPDDTFAGFQEGGTECNVRPVNSYPKGRSPYGVHNMAGNVFEYVSDWFSLVHMDKLRDGVRNPVAKEPSLLPDEPHPYRMLRGGRWASGIGEINIYGNIDLFRPDRAFRCYGARFALDAEAARELLATGAASIVP